MLQMLKPFHLDTSKNKSCENYVNSDKACNIVGLIFKFINNCLDENKSKKEISLFARSLIKGVLNDKTKHGINDFIKNMPDKDIEVLLDEIKSELMRKS